MKKKFACALMRRRPLGSDRRRSSSSRERTREKTRPSARDFDRLLATFAAAAVVINELRRERARARARHRRQRRKASSRVDLRRHARRRSCCRALAVHAVYKTAAACATATRRLHFERRADRPQFYARASPTIFVLNVARRSFCTKFRAHIFRAV